METKNKKPKKQQLPKVITATTSNGTVIRLEKVSKKEIRANRPRGYVCMFK